VDLQARKYIKRAKKRASFSLQRGRPSWAAKASSGPAQNVKSNSTILSQEGKRKRLMDDEHPRGNAEKNGIEDKRVRRTE